MIISLVSLTVRDLGSVGELRHGLNYIVENTMKEEGCVAIRVFEPADFTGRFIIYEEWLDDAAVSTHRAGSTYNYYCNKILPFVDRESFRLSIVDKREK